MAYGGGAAAAAAAHAIAQAVKASGAIVRLEPEDFLKIVSKTRAPLVVMAPSGFMQKGYRYLTSYKGLFFYTKSSTGIQLPGDAEIVSARSIWIPG